MSKQNKQSGFTIIELLIATAIMSFLLILVTVVVINIGNLYYKTITQSRVQGNARTIIDEVSRRITTNDGDPQHRVSPDTHTQFYCVGNTRYAFNTSRQVTSTQHVLWRDRVPSGSCVETDVLGNPAASTNTFLDTLTPSDSLTMASLKGTELITPRARLANFCISSPGRPPCDPSGGSPFTIAIDIAIGDDDQLCNALIANDCNVETTSTNLNDPARRILCKGIQSGRQFCATGNLTITVVQRLQ